jgi:starch phosphorylase
MDRYFGSYISQLGVSRSEFLGLGRKDPSHEGEDFCMTVLALRMAASSNGVSALHGKVSRNMWKSLWPGVPEGEVPIGHVTNGVHFRSWISLEANQLYDRYLGPKWREESADPALWERAKAIPSEEVWRTHERRRIRLVAFARRRLRLQLQARGASQAEIDAADEVLDPDTLTIGFARRFATYKRATLLLRDPERLGRILNHTGKPVQILFAGKAHPRDEAGKQLIQQIVRFAQKEEFRRRVVFLEDYDMAVARYLVQGVDVWLNTPLRPLEASGTSGMKAMANGGLNLSILDGWWDEAWRDAFAKDQLIGWAIGRGEKYESAEFQNEVESAALYDLLERDIIPTFYDRAANGLPRRWIALMKSSIAALCPSFNMHRVVKQYTADFYVTAHERYERLMKDSAARVRALAAWTERIRNGWGQVRIDLVESPPVPGLAVGDTIRPRAWVHLGSIGDDEVSVELWIGRVDSAGEIIDGVAVPMEPSEKTGDGRVIFEAAPVPCSQSGLHGFTVRILPYHLDQTRALIPGLITWAVGRARNLCID